MIIASPVTVTAVPDTSMSPFKTESAAPAPNSTSPVNVAPDKVTAASVINNVPPNTKSVSDVAFVTAEPEIITSPKKVTPSKVAADSSKASSAILAFLKNVPLAASKSTFNPVDTPSKVVVEVSDKRIADPVESSLSIDAPVKPLRVPVESVIVSAPPLRTVIVFVNTDDPAANVIEG